MMRLFLTASQKKERNNCFLTVIVSWNWDHCVDELTEGSNEIKEKRKATDRETREIELSIMVILSPSLSLFTSNHFLVPPNLFFREHSRTVVHQQSKCRAEHILEPCSKPNFQNGFCRRELLLFGLSSPLLTVLPSSGSLAEEDVKMASFADEINSYSYLYPVELQSKKVIFKWVESRKPERYSSAAPLSPDARLRIVSERVDIIDNLIISISIGPPNSKIIKSPDKSTWTAKDVADSVLADKSALRVTSTQRMAESSILDAHTSEIDGQPYWNFEYLVRKAPTKTAQESNSYRHYVASTTERDGYLYCINASTLNKQWNIMGPILQKTVDSFHLLPPTENYVPPFKDPWRFW